MIADIEPTSNLEGYRRLANDEHRLAWQSANAAVEHAKQSGEALLQIKRLLAHGEFLLWIKDHFDGSDRTARAYMRIASNWQSSANFDSSSLAGALASLKPAERSSDPRSMAPSNIKSKTTEGADESVITVGNNPSIPAGPSTSENRNGAENLMEFSSKIQGLLNLIDQPTGMGRVVLCDILRYCCRRLDIEPPRGL